MGNPFGGSGGLGNMGGMMKQAKKMYEDMQKAQEELDNARIEASSGGGMVKVIVTGKGDLVEISIDPQVVDPEDVEMLQDLVLSAVREAQEKATKYQAERMQQVTGGMALPGMF